MSPELKEAAYLGYVIAFGPIGMIALILFLKWKNQRDDQRLEREMTRIRQEIAERSPSGRA